MKHRKKIAAAAIAVAILTSAESCEDSGQTESRKQGQALTQQAYAQQAKARPYPASQLKDSLERANLTERLLRQNKPGQIGYVYFFPFGSDKALGYWTIKGKVSSTQSQMTPSDSLENQGCSGCSDVVAEAPGDDGSFGENEKGVFFFTTEGAMVQVCEDCYFYSDQPVNLGSIPELNGKS